MNTNSKTFQFSYKRRFITITLLIFIIFTIFAAIFQYKREKEFSIDKLEERLNIYSNTISNFIKIVGFDPEKTDLFLKYLPDSTIRVSIIKYNGDVIFDSEIKNTKNMVNHINRPEIAIADKYGYGGNLRKSESTNKKYYYFAKKSDGYFVRCALPYDMTASTVLETNKFFIYYYAALFFIILIFIIYVSQMMDKIFFKLRNFVSDIKLNKPIKKPNFPEDELGEVCDYIVNLYSQLQQANTQLIGEKEKLYLHLQITKEGVGIFSSDKKELLSNEYFAQYVNTIASSQLSSFDNLLDLTEFAQISEYIDVGLQEGGNSFKFKPKSFFINKNNKMFIVNAVIFNDNSFEISISDATALIEQEELKKQLTQNIAHELKTPVSSIQGFMETIINNPELPDEKRNFFIERSYNQCIRLANLVSDISILNKIESASDTFEKEVVNIKEIFGGILNDVYLQLKEKNISVSVLLPDNIQVNGNRSLLYSALRNMVDNSLLYAGENFNITLNCYREDENFLYFSFYDTGIGIEEKHFTRIFDRFYRIDKGRSRKLGGTGLGLSIVKNAILYHNGNISAKKHEGGGLEFIFSLEK